MVGGAFWDGERNERRAGQGGEQGLALQKWTSISKNGIGEDYPYVELK